MPTSASPIGVFDSGIGGLSILRALRAALPGEDFIYYADTRHAPYGERGDAFVIDRSLAIAGELIADHHIKLLVVACNTATAAAIARMRQAWPELPIVGVEPALKPAVQATRTGRIGVLATRGTLESAKFRQLHDSLQTQTQAQVLLQPCDGLAAAIETGDAARAQSLGARYLAALGPLGTQDEQIDTLVLGCTHYALMLPTFRQLAGPEVRILETGEPVARQVARLLARDGLASPATAPGRITLLSPGAQDALELAAARWLSPA